MQAHTWLHRLYDGLSELCTVRKHSAVSDAVEPMDSLFRRSVRGVVLDDDRGSAVVHNHHVEDQDTQSRAREAARVTVDFEDRYC